MNADGLDAMKVAEKEECKKELLWMVEDQDHSEPQIVPNTINAPRSNSPGWIVLQLDQDANIQKAEE